MSETQVDLDKLLVEFNSWQLHVNEVTKKNRSLKDEVDGLKKLLEASQERQASLVKGNQELRANVCELQKSLNKRCDFEDQNNQLKKEKEACKEELTDIQKRLEDTNVKHEEEKVLLSQMHKDELEALKENFTKEASDESARMQEEINLKSKTISELNQRLVSTEKETEADLMKLRLEYDSKLLKLQKKNNKSQQMSTSQSGQEIFRKKLQHTKEEYEKEVTSLKKTVDELTQQLQAKKQDVIRGRSFDCGLSLSKKRKT